jgi:hypothetical protein
MNRARSGRRRAVWATAFIVALSGLVVVGVPAVVRGPRFGRIVQSALPRTRGEIRVGGGQWTWAAAWALWRGRPARLVLDDVRITDPEGTEVLRARRLTGELVIDRDRSDVVIRHLEVADAAWRFTNMRGHPQIGFLAALEPTSRSHSTGGPKPSGAGSHLSFRIEDTRLEGLDVVLEYPDWGLLLKDVMGAGRLSYEQQGAKQAFAFEVHGANARGGGRLRILDRSHRIELPFSVARLDKVSSTGATAASVPDSIFIAASQIVTGHSALSLRGTFVGVLAATGPERPAGIDLQAHVDDAADAVQEIVVSNGLAAQLQVAGRTGSLAMTFLGPFEDIVIGADARGFILRRGPLEAREFGFGLSANTAAARIRLTRLTLASPAGGRLNLDAEVDAARAWGTLTLDGLRLPSGPLLLIPLRPLADGTLRGRLKVRVDRATKAAFFDELALTLLRPAGVSGPRVVRVSTDGATWKVGSKARSLRISGAGFSDGALHFRKLTMPLAGGRVTARGRIVLWDVEHAGWLPAPVSDLKVQADRVSIEQLIGNAFVTGAISARLRVSGPLGENDVRVAFPPREGLHILGEWYELPPAISFRLDGEGLQGGPVRVRGDEGAELGAAGRIGLDGHLDLAVTVHQYPFRKLPALKDADLPFSGRLSGQLRLTGDAEQPRMVGALSIDGARFRDQPIGGGLLAITSESQGRIRARGQLMEGVSMDGTLAPRAAGLEGDGAVQFDRLRMDPFLAGLPGGIKAVGTVTGNARMQMAAGSAPSFSVRLTEVTLALKGPATKSAAMDLRTDGEVRLSIRGGRNAAMRLQPVRLVGAAGSFLVAGDSDGGMSSATVSGRLNLAALASLAAPWIDALSGAVDLDLRAAVDRVGRTRVAKGRVSIATPVSFRLRDQRALGVAQIHAGQIDVDDETVSLRSVELGIGHLVRMTIGAERALPGTILLRMTGPRAIDLGAIDLAHVDLPMRGDVHGLVTPAASVDSATFALRLAGEPRRQLSLRGDVELLAARARSSPTTASIGTGASSSWLARPEIARMQLDVRVKARSGALVVVVPRAPDLRVNADLRIQGTPAHPEPSGDIHGATVYSSLALLVYRIFH